MKERPIIFSGPMVLAILDGRKTETRRVLKPQPPIGTLAVDHVGNGEFVRFSKSPGCLRGIHAPYARRCPYGQPSDLLWVRETWAAHPMRNCFKPSELPHGYPFVYRADQGVNKSHYWWRPSIHMPRWASRITLEITGVRVERVQNMMPDDAYREGVAPYINLAEPDYLQPFRELWNSINAKRGFGWDTDPWVWVIEFKPVVCVTNSSNTAG